VEKILTMEFLVLLIHHLATDSKSTPKWIPKMFKIAFQRFLTTIHSKSKGITDSSSEQKIQVLSSTCLHLCRLSLVRVLLLAKRQKNTWILGAHLASK
jgi:hypothetical protein